MRSPSHFEAKLSRCRIIEILVYDPSTGMFQWKEPHPKAGRSAGFTLTHGYVGMQIDGYRYRAHRVAWIIAKGAWPIGFIDHIDGNRANNAISNLRDVSHSENLKNARHKGCHYRSDVGGYQARITVGAKRIHLGYFPSREAAESAYRAASVAHFGQLSPWSAEFPVNSREHA